MRHVVYSVCQNLSSKGRILIFSAFSGELFLHGCVSLATLVPLMVTGLKLQKVALKVLSIMAVLSLMSERRESDTQRFAEPANHLTAHPLFPQIPQQFAGQFSEIQALCLLKAGKLGLYCAKSPFPLRS